MCRSVPQIATASTLHSTSIGPGSGTGTSRISWRCGPVSTTAFMVAGIGSLSVAAGAVVAISLSPNLGEETLPLLTPPLAAAEGLLGRAPAPQGDRGGDRYSSRKATTRQMQPSPPTQRHGNAPMVTRRPATWLISPPRFSSIDTSLRAVL